MAWHHAPIAPWQTESWLDQMRRSLRANQFLRMIQNQFVTSESSFVDLEKWDACVDPTATPLISNPGLPIWVGVDASVKHDSTAIVAVTFDQALQRVRLVSHKVFQPSPDEPLDFESTIEATILDLSRRFNIRRVIYDPYQMQHTSQRLTRAGIRIEEFPQSQGNLTSISQNLFELIEGQNLIVYPDAAMRLSVSHAVAVETSRGWRITKQTKSHKIDVVVALAMACWAAVSMGANADLKKVKWYAATDAGIYGEDGFTPNSAVAAVRSAFGSVVYDGTNKDYRPLPNRLPTNTGFLTDGGCDRQQR